MVVEPPAARWCDSHTLMHNYLQLVQVRLGLALIWMMICIVGRVDRHVRRAEAGGAGWCGMTAVVRLLKRISARIGHGVRI